MESPQCNVKLLPEARGQVWVGVELLAPQLGKPRGSAEEAEAGNGRQATRTRLPSATCWEPGLPACSNGKGEASCHFANIVLPIITALLMTC